MTKVVVIGAGGMGREVAETILAATAAGQEWDLLGFIDDNPAVATQTICGLPVLGSGRWVADHPDIQLAMGIGHPLTRWKIIQKFAAYNPVWATVLHPSVIVSPSACIGQGSIIFAGCVISADATVGELCYMNYNSVLSHDAQLGKDVCIMAQVALSGNVAVGEGAFIGVGVSTRQGVSIGEWSIIGAGASVVRDIPSYSVAMGVPAQVTRHYTSQLEMPGF